jgi:hypothetical protein
MDEERRSEIAARVAEMEEYWNIVFDGAYEYENLASFAERNVGKMFRLLHELLEALRNPLADEGPVRTDVWVGGRSGGEARL